MVVLGGWLDSMSLEVFSNLWSYDSVIKQKNSSHWFQSNPPKSAEVTGGGAGQTTLHHLSAVLAKREGPRQLEDHQCNTHLQEGPEGGSWEPQACQLNLGAGKVKEQII